MNIVIGNGESRKNIDISSLKGFKIGCNAIYLHEKVDMLSAFDKFWRDKIIKETSIPLLSRRINNQYQRHIQIYDKGWKDTDTLYEGFCSGISALDWVAQHKEGPIYMIGFDFSYKGETVDHMYKGTPNHPPANYRAQNSSIFLNECIKVLKKHPWSEIIYVNDISCPEMRKQMTVDEFLLKQKE